MVFLFFFFFFRFVPVLFRIRYISLTISYQHVLLILWDRWNYGENRQNIPLVYSYFKMKHEVHCVKLIFILHDCAVTFVYFSVFVIRFELAIWTKIVITGDKKIIWRLQPGTKQRHWIELLAFEGWFLSCFAPFWSCETLSFQFHLVRWNSEPLISDAGTWLSTSIQWH